MVDMDDVTYWKLRALLAEKGLEILRQRERTNQDTIKILLDMSDSLEIELECAKMNQMEVEIWLMIYQFMNGVKK